MQNSNEVKPAQEVKTLELSGITRERKAVTLQTGKRVVVCIHKEKAVLSRPEYSAIVECELNAEERVEMYLWIKDFVRGCKCFMAMQMLEPEQA